MKLHLLKVWGTGPRIMMRNMVHRPVSVAKFAGRFQTTGGEVLFGWKKKIHDRTARLMLCTMTCVLQIDYLPT